MEQEGGIQWPCNDRFPKGAKRLYGEDIPFRTPDGRANLICADWVPMKEAISEAFPIILNTGRTVEQWHTRTKTAHIDILNDLVPEAWVEINPLDAEALQVRSGDRIALSSARGKVTDVIVKVTQTVQPGTVFVPFHYNTQLINRLTQAEFDPISGEPNYKQTAIQLHSSKVPEGIKLKREAIQGALNKPRLETEMTKATETTKDNA